MPPIYSLHPGKLFVLVLLLFASVAIAYAADKPVDINHATAEELAQSLSGIGPKKAERIVKWREDHGPFPTIDTLLEVPGIGQRTLDKLRHQLTIGDVSPTALLQSSEGRAMQAVQAIVSRAKREAERFRLTKDIKRKAVLQSQRQCPSRPRLHV